MVMTLQQPSSNIDEVIRSVLIFFYYDKISQVQKSIKKIQGTKSTINILGHFGFFSG